MRDPMLKAIGNCLLTISIVAGATSWACTASADAQSWPAHPIRILAGFGRGGGTDVVARILAPALSEVLGQPVVVENMPGTGGTIAASAVAKAAPDGYTALMMSSGHTIAAVMYSSLPYDSAGDFQPV